MTKMAKRLATRRDELTKLLKSTMQAIASEYPDIPSVTDLDDIDADSKGSAWNRAYGRYWQCKEILENLKF
jgi:hypothetical protein